MTILRAGHEYSAVRGTYHEIRNPSRPSRPYNIHHGPVQVKSFDLISSAKLGSYSNGEVKQQSENNVRRMEGTE